MENGKLNLVGRGYVYLPSDYFTHVTSRPVIHFFHGSGEAGNSGEESKLLSQGLPWVVKNLIDTNKMAGSVLDNFIIVALQSAPNADMSPTAKEMWNYFNALDLSYDPNCVYATGLSAGGNQTFLAIKTHADKYAAFVPMSSMIWLGAADCQQYAKYSGTGVWGFAGKFDTAGSINTFKSTIEKIQRLNDAKIGSALFTTMDAGHSGWLSIYNPDWTWESNVLAPLDWDKTEKIRDIGPINHLSIYDWMLQHSLSSSIQSSASDPVESEPEEPANPPAGSSDSMPESSPVRIMKIVATMSDGTEAELFNATK